MEFWVLLHLLGAALWLGGLVFLAALVAVALRTLPRDEFRAVARLGGWAFAGVSTVAWVLLASSGVVLAGSLRWPAPVKVKAGLGVFLVVATAGHVWAGRHSDRRTLAGLSRLLALAILAATLAAFWLGVSVAEGQTL